MAKFNVGDKVRRVNPDNDHKFWDEPDDNLFHGNIYTVKECNSKGISLEGCRHLYSAKYFELVEPAQQQPILSEADEVKRDMQQCCDTLIEPTLHTQSELTEIEQLQDRVEYLESLCKDYTSEIGMLKGQAEAWEEVFDLLVEHPSVVDAGTGIGIATGTIKRLQKLYDQANNCVEREVKQKTDFKPISEMTIDDWRQALDERWGFETRNGRVVNVDKVGLPTEPYPVFVEELSYTLQGRWIDGNEDNDDIVKRIK